MTFSSRETIALVGPRAEPSCCADPDYSVHTRACPRHPLSANMNRPGNLGDSVIRVFSWSRYCKPIKMSLILRWGKLAKRFEQSARVEPCDPFERRVFDVLKAPPRPGVTDDLRLEQADNRFGERVVVCVAADADRRLDPRFRRRSEWRIDRCCEPRSL